MSREPLTYTCRVCARTTAHPVDAADGYCPSCHDWTRDCTCVWALRAQDPPTHGRYTVCTIAEDCPVHARGRQ